MSSKKRKKVYHNDEPKKILFNPQILLQQSDVVVQICGLLDSPDLVSFAMTSKKIHGICSDILVSRKKSERSMRNVKRLTAAIMLQTVKFICSKLASVEHFHFKDVQESRRRDLRAARRNLLPTLKDTLPKVIAEVLRGLPDNPGFHLLNATLYTRWRSLFLSEDVRLYVLPTMRDIERILEMGILAAYPTLEWEEPDRR